MSIKIFLKYVFLPLLAVLALIFAIFYRQITLHVSFSSKFDQLIEHRGRDSALTYADEILALGPAAGKKLQDKYRLSTNNVEKYYSLYLLGRLQDRTALPLFTKGMQDPSPTVRLGAVRGFKHLTRTGDLALVLPLLYDGNKEIRFEVATILGKLDEPAGLRALYEFVRRERDVSVWRRAWLSIRFLEGADGLVTRKFRINRNLQEIPLDDRNNEVGLTFFFAEIKNGTGVKVVNLPGDVWSRLKMKDHLIKAKNSEAFEIVPADGPAT